MTTSRSAEPTSWGISVVIPTYRQPASVARVLSSVADAAAALPDGASSEFIVVDDSPPSDAASIVESCARHGARYLRGPRRVGAKRNVGARSARYPVVLFIDSDCRATAQLLTRHLDAHAGARAASGREPAAVAGPTVVQPDEHLRVWRIVAPSMVVNSPFVWPTRFGEVWWAPTANLSVRRAALDAIGGFDDNTYTVVGGEDVDFGVRLYEAGMTTICRPDAVVIHETDGITRLRQFHRKLFRYGRACAYNCRRQPRYARWSANPVSAVLAAGALSVPLGSAGLLAAAAAGFAAWFAVEVVRNKRRTGQRLGDSAAMVSVDWAFHAGITAEALRRLRPLLAFKRFDYLHLAHFYPRTEPVPEADWR